MKKQRSKTAKYTVRIAAMLICAALIIFFAARIRPEGSPGQFTIKYDLTLWYYDENLTGYLSSFGDDYFKETGRRVDVKLMPSLEFFDNINKRNIEGSDAPDLYVIDSSKLEHAYLSSLAKPNQRISYDDGTYLAKGIEAATYKDTVVGYPLAFNTSFLAYNTEYVKEAPEYFTDIPFADRSAKERRSSDEDTSDTDEQKRSLDMDVSDLLYSYAFIGEYIDLGGPAGDDASSFDLSRKKYTRALKKINSFGEKYDIDPKLSDYRSVERGFIQNKTQTAVFSVNSLTKLYGSGVDFDICRVPDLNKKLKTKPLSQTSVICVNPLSKDVVSAEDLAVFLTDEYSDNIFNSCGLMSVRKTASDNEDLKLIEDIYNSSASLPKLIETENIWENISNLITDVWTGGEVERAQSKLNVSVYVALSTRTSQEDE